MNSKQKVLERMKQVGSVLIVLLFVALVEVSVVSAKVDYKGEPVIIVNVTNLYQLKALEKYQELSERSGISAFDVWTRGSNLGLGRNDIHIRKPVLENLLIFKELNMTYDYMYNDIQAAIDDVTNIHSPVENNLGAPVWFNSYHTFESIVSYAKTLCGLRSDICKFNSSIATSINGRSIVSLHLYGGDAAASRKQIWINAGQHAREWIAPASLMYILEQLISNYGVNRTVTTLINQVEFIIVPIVNPDGYDWSWTNERLWRKNRRNNGAGYGLGVDLNRNWASHWGKGGSSTNPNSDTYMGKAPFSEPESKGVAEYFLQNKIEGQVVFAIDYHSYSELVLYPWGYTRTAPSNIAQLKAAAKVMVDAIKSTPGGVTYTAQSSYDLYITTGTATDWFYMEEGGNVPIAFTLEGRDTGRYGFVLPASLIVQSGEENWNAFYSLCLHTLNLQEQV